MIAKSFYKPFAERRSRRLSVRGIDYCIHEWGAADAPLMFWLHGWGDTGSTFQFVADRLASHWRIVAPDWRGFGRTTSRAEAYWFPDYIADLDAILDAFSPGTPVRIAAHSMGANAGMLYAGSTPERVAALVNVEGFGLPDTKSAAAPDRYRDWLTASREQRSFTEYRDFDALASVVRKRNSGIGLAEAGFVAREWARRDDDGVVRLRADPNHKRPNAVLYRRAEAEACWRRIEARVLVVTGDRSRLAAGAASIAALASLSARTVEIEDAGHMLHFERPEALAAAIHAFFGDIPAKPID